MKVQVVSDLHLEFCKFGEIQTIINDICNVPCDVRVLAGDIAVSWLLPAFLARLAYKSKVPIVFVAGNHDHYSDSDLIISQISDEAKSKGYTYLSRQTLVLSGQRFVGCTGWYEIDPDPYLINDGNHIPKARRCVAQWGKQDRKFLESTVTGEDVVITHYLPHRSSIAPEYVSSDNRYFYVPYDALIEERKPKLWIHGHTHTAADYTLDSGTRIVCNPRGYPGEKTGFKFYKVITL